jgi:hypothetical protein
MIFFGGGGGGVGGVIVFGLRCRPLLYTVDLLATAAAMASI